MEQKIKKLLKWLDLGELKNLPKEVEGGLLHKMYCVVTSKGKFAVKILNNEIMKRKFALQNTINSERIASTLKNSIPAAAALDIKGRQIHLLDGEYYMVFDWIEGSSVFLPYINEKHCACIGDILGKIHKLNISVDGVEPEQETVKLYDWDKYLLLAKKQLPQDTTWLALYEKSINDLKAWNEAVFAVKDILASYLVISHRDLDPKNVMWNGMNPILIDWEAAGYVNPHQELLEVINYWADDGKGGLVISYIDALLTAYKKQNSLDCMENTDWEAVFAGGCAGMLGWLEYNVKRALEMEISSNDEVMLGVEQVKGTIKALNDYHAKISIMKKVLYSHM